MAGDFSELSVLIVDSDLSMRSLTKDILLSVGIKRVESVIDGDRAYAELRSRAFDIVITERELDSMGGIELTRKIRAAADIPNRHIPILMMTGAPSREAVFEARDAGVTEFLIKPFSVDILRDRVSAIVNQPRSFIEVANYFGPDRRRSKKGFHGQNLRHKPPTG